MMTTLAALAFTILTVSLETDTTLVVKPGTALELDNHSGDIVVSAWSRNAVRVRAEHSHRARVLVTTSSGSVRIKAEGPRGVPAHVEYRLEVPAWMPLTLTSVSSEVSVVGSESEVTVSTVHGDIRLEGGKKFVSLSSVDGELLVIGARGRIELSAVNGGIAASEVSGELVAAETVSGDITFEQASVRNLQASTVNGDVTFSGPFLDDGAYAFSTHAGDVTIAMAEKANVSVSVATFSGEFASSFPIRLADVEHGKRFSFTLGTGRARIEIQSFNGDVVIQRPGESGGPVKLKTKHPGSEYELEVEVEQENEDGN